MTQVRKGRGAAKAPQKVSEGAVRKATGKGWDEWFRILDRFGAERHGHKAAALWLEKEQGVGGWWAQSIAVQHEWARGLRSRATLRFGGREVQGDLIADGEQMTFRSEEYTLGVPVAKVTKAEARGEDVYVTFHRGTAVFAGLGTNAPRWAMRFRAA